MKSIYKFFAVTTLAATGLILWISPPLLPSKCVVNCVINGKVFSNVRGFSPLFMNNLVYVKNPEVKPDFRYRWFLIDFPRRIVASPIAVYTAPFDVNYIHRDQAKGIGFTNEKISDKWSVDFNGDRSVVLSNSYIHLVVTR